LDHITCKLATQRAPAVISSNTTRRFFKMSVEPQEIGRQLGANYAVSGSVRSYNNQAAVSIQLTNTRNNQIVWANTHQCSASDLFDVNIPIASEIAQVLSPSLNAAELARTMLAPVEDLEPYHLLLRAKDLIFKLDRGSFREAGALLKRAILANPHFGPAHSLIAEWFAIALWQGWTTDASGDAKAMETHLQRAVSLSPGDGRALGLWGHGQLMFHHRYDDALNAVNTAIDLCPSDAETLIWAVPTFAMSGNPERGIEIGEKAVRLSPLDPFAFRNEHFLGIAHYAAGNFARSAALGLSSYQRAPNYASNLRTTIASLVAIERTDEAKEMVARHHTVEPDFTVEELFARQTFKSNTQRREYCDQLLAAGMP
jgi:tetratricopeptide (TPR) repeat protein